MNQFITLGYFVHFIHKKPLEIDILSLFVGIPDVYRFGICRIRKNRVVSTLCEKITPNRSEIRRFNKDVFVAEKRKFSLMDFLILLFSDMVITS